MKSCPPTLESPEPQLLIIEEKLLVGMCARTSLARDCTGELWRRFSGCLVRHGGLGDALRYSVNIYGAGYFEKIDPRMEFDKWAAVEASQFEKITVPGAPLPEGVDYLLLQGGTYAVFTHLGPAAGGAATFGYIYGEWLTASGYALDARPHFEILGPQYRHNDPAAREDIFIPIKRA